MSGGRDVVVLGVGLHPFGRFPERTIDDLAREAALAALDDAGIAFRDVEAGFLGRVGGSGPPVGVGTRIFAELGSTASRSRTSSWPAGAPRAR